jgi:hypothetical protein
LVKLLRVAAVSVGTATRTGPLGVTLGGVGVDVFAGVAVVGVTFGTGVTFGEGVVFGTGVIRSVGADLGGGVTVIAGEIGVIERPAVHKIAINLGLMLLDFMISTSPYINSDDYC